MKILAELIGKGIVNMPLVWYRIQSMRYLFGAIQGANRAPLQQHPGNDRQYPAGQAQPPLAAGGKGLGKG
jgi:hypothetical protein